MLVIFSSERGRRRLDLAIGVALGLGLGVAVVVAFVFYGSEGTVDSPRISGVDTGKPAPARPAPRPRPSAPTVQTIHVIGGAPPSTGAPRLRFHRGERVRLRIDTDAPVAIEIPGYGIAEKFESGAVVAFRARRAGQFPVVAAASHIGLAELDIAP